MNMRTFMVVLGAVGSLIAGAACEVTTTGNTGGAGGSGGTGGDTTASSTTTASTTAGIGGAGGAGGGAATCGCGSYITDPSECAGGFNMGSEALYDDLFACYCGTAATPGPCMMDCSSTSCADPPKDPDSTCGNCVLKANMMECKTQYDSCANDI